MLSAGSPRAALGTSKRSASGSNRSGDREGTGRSLPGGCDILPGSGPTRSVLAEPKRSVWDVTCSQNLAGVEPGQLPSPVAGHFGRDGGKRAAVDR